MKSGIRDGLLLLTTSECDMDEVSGEGSVGEGAGVLFPNKISTSTLKRGASCKRTFLLKEKRESIVWGSYHFHKLKVLIYKYICTTSHILKEGLKYPEEPNSIGTTKF